MTKRNYLRVFGFGSEALRGSAVLATSFALFLAGCGDDSGSESSVDDAADDDGGEQPDLPEGVYESSNPAGPDGDQFGPGRDEGEAGGDGSAGDDAAGDDGATDGEDPPSEPQAPDEDGGEAERAIEEADIIKLEGDRLYALSAYGGLSIIDVSDPDALELVGRHRSTATPFEMYVREDNVFVLYNGYGEYSYDGDEDEWTYYQTSYVISLDASDPKAISEAQKFEIEGFISDSRLIGDVMYVVAYDDSYCYRCSDAPKTNVMSLDVGEPAAIEKVDELSFPERQDEYSWRRSLSATDERLYIAGPRYGSGLEPEGSIIQVVDVSEADGVMQAGDAVQVAGQINSRWQMDEHEGVLRVVSQPMWWLSDAVPVIETFTIESSDELNPLGSLPLVLPRPEELKAVRFDGDRGYAITFERTDPLFTLDLSDPANPIQAGELEMPGWVYHMEPRGDRVIGLGFDQGNAEGALTVSIFDVSDLSAPTMLDRVNFGGVWAELAEDQDRIHKSFQVLDEHELVLVPFSGWVFSDEECGRSDEYISGVQLVDWSGDSLDLRGIAESQGRSRRAFILDERLLTMSDERLESFDIDDRSEPTSTSRVDLAQIVGQLATVGDTVVRIGNAWYGQELEATVSSLEELQNFAPGATVALPGLNSYDCNSESWLQTVMSGGGHVYFVYRHYDYSGDRDKYDTIKVMTLDVSDPSEPKIAGDVDLDFTPSYGRSYVPGMVDNGQAALAVGNSLVFAEHDTEYNDLGFVTKSGYTIEVVDFSDPSEPQHQSVKMPDSLGSTNLLASGEVVATSHFERSPSNPDNVRFYLDRVDLSDPSDPQVMDPVNIPGSLLAYDHENSRTLSVDYRYLILEDVSPQQCYEEEYGQFLTDDPSVVDYTAGRGECAALRYTLHLSEIDGNVAELLDSYEADKGVQITAAAIGEDRVFIGTAHGGYYYGGRGDVADDEPGIGGFGGYYYGFSTGQSKLLVASGLATGKLEVASVELETTNDFYGFSGLIAKGTSAVVSTGWQGRLSVIDASDPSQPAVRDSAELGGYVQDLDLAGNVVIAALGQAGVQTIDLGSE